jgi:uncharacterized protein YecE (DUF72 family)
MKLLVGAGGWAYFRVEGISSLEAYSRAFDFVEVNSTFYEKPSLQLVKSWRRRVPRNFEFSVRCHKDVTHTYKLEPINEVFDVFETMVKVCSLLNSYFLVLVTPSTLAFTPKKIASIRALFNGLNLNGVRLVWEVRRRTNDVLSPRIISLMQDHNVVPCVDLSREDPVADSDTLYSRVFGKGEHNLYQFTDEELVEVDRRIMREKRDEAVISFHNVKMYKDAARYKIFKQRKRFPSVTGVTGQQSLKKVLMEDTTFPATKQELVKTQGWKVIDLTKNKRTHAHVLLERLPDRCFRSIEEVIMNLHKNVQSSVMSERDPK